MQKLVLFTLRLYYTAVSYAWPSLAARKAFYLFQTTRRLPFKKAEEAFYQQARSFDVVHPSETIHGYEWGDPSGDLVFLVHGWESNAGSMAAIGQMLIAQGYHVVSFDLPAHGRSSLKRTNLHACREAFRAVIYHLQPQAPFHVISHSFGSAVAAFTLAGTRYRVASFVMLTSPDKLIHIFEDFARMINLRGVAFEQLIERADAILKEPLRELTVARKLSQIQVSQLTLIHDQFDKILPYANSRAIQEAHPHAVLHTLKNTGHYRMLWNEPVLELIAASMANSVQAVASMS